MPVPKNKTELQSAITENYAKLKTDLARVPLDLAKNKDLDGHAKNTKMSVADLVAYLVGWGELVLKWHQQKRKGAVIFFPAEGYKWTELGLLAQQFYKDYEADSFPVLLEKLDKTVADIQKIITQTDNDILYGEGWYKHYPMGRMIQLNTAAPYKNARTRLRKWLREIEENR